MSGKQKKPEKTEDLPPAGPHDKPELTDEEKTPGAGALPEPGEAEDSTTG